MKHLTSTLFFLSIFSLSISAQASEWHRRFASPGGGHVDVYKMSEFELRSHLGDVRLNSSNADDDRENDSEDDGVVGEVADASVKVIEALSAGKFWVIGEKVYKIIKENEAVLNINTDRWSVLPEGVDSAVKLEGWAKPEYSGWIVNYTNLYGMNVARVSFLTAYNYGGKFEGKGQYLANVTIIPRDLHTYWGYSMDMDAEAFGAVNEATSQDPVVGLSFHVRVRVGTIVKKSVLDFQYYVNGKGELDIVPID